jgi:hypothetical protein
VGLAHVFDYGAILAPLALCVKVYGWGAKEISMPISTTIVRQYTSQQQYTQDATRLAKLGYVVISVVEQPSSVGWAQRLRQLLFVPARVRLLVSYSDQGAAV